MSAKIWDSAAQAFADPQNVPKRYDAGSGAFVDTEGKAFDHDEESWKEVWPDKTYLIRDGADKVAGGWKWIRLVGTPSEAWMPGYLQLTNTYQFGSTNWYITNEPVNLEGKSRLCITVDVQGTVDVIKFMGLFNNNTFPASNVQGISYATHAFDDPFAKTTICIDFVPATGKYIGFGVGVVGGTTVFRIYDVWLE